MPDRDIATFGLFPSQESLERAVADLRHEGFRNSDVSILMAETPGNKALAHEAHTKAPEGATTGAGTGAIVGGVLGWLLGVGALTIPGIGPFIAAGPIVAALAGMGAAGTAGGLIGALVGAGLPEYRSEAVRRTSSPRAPARIGARGRFEVGPPGGADPEKGGSRSRQQHRRGVRRLPSVARASCECQRGCSLGSLLETHPRRPTT